ncbi:MAG: PhzF family phenazine biosynthesis protein [Planctomycetota bacterium]
MKLPIHQIDAFTSELFRGNPAAVVLLEEWLPDALLQAIAMENNLSETAFVRPQGEAFGLRWFTPRVEVDLCGHATLASAFVLFEEGLVAAERVRFETSSGALTVEREGALLLLDFPARPPRPSRRAPSAGTIEAALGARPQDVLIARDLLVIHDDEEQIRGLRPDFARIAALDAFAVIASAPGREADFVSRFFAPRAGVPEDPVTGSAHCTLVPYWSERLGKSKLRALQLSERGGELFLEDRGDRVTIAGRATPYLRGEIGLDGTS